MSLKVDRQPDRRHVTDSIERLNANAQLAIVCAFCGVGSFVISSFGIYRLIRGDYLIAFVDGILVLVHLGGLAYVWKTGSSTTAGNVSSVLVTAVALWIIPAYGLSFIWLFSLMIGIFLMSESRVAILLSLLLIGGIGRVPELFDDPLERVTFFAVAAQVPLFSFLFAWRMSRQHDQLDVMANRDPLTKLGNRRALQREMLKRAEAARLVGERAVLAVIDLDHFKHVNDRLGHSAGDQVLIDLAGIVGETMRSADTFYRYGGEEFVLVMPGTTPEGVVAALDKLQAAC